MRLIDGDRLMMSLTDWWYSSFGEEETEESEAIYAVMEKVEESLPHMTIEPERKKGRWIQEPNCMFRCSRCGNHYPDIRGYMTFNYCPNCGADLRHES